MLSKREDYVKALINEITQRSHDFKKRGLAVTTIYIGGGTPSVLSASLLQAILAAISRNYPLEHSKLVLHPEITIELNPDDVTLSYAKELFRCGDDIGLSFNRVSLGIQSFNDKHLKWMNRRHSSAKAVEAFYLLREAGFKNISIDLIFGFEDLSMQEWKANIKKAIALSPEHISSYQLGIEKGTKLYKSYASGDYMPLEDDISYRQYSVLQQMLAEAGYYQYEVSSFCLPGKESRHNSSYWNFTPYFGFGPAAHSFIGLKNGLYGGLDNLHQGLRREWNSRGINKYIQGWANTIRHNSKSNLNESETLTRRDLFNEFIMLSLRTTEGINRDLLINEQLSRRELFLKKTAALIIRGDLVQTPTHIRIPSDKLFISDNIIRELFDLPEIIC